MPDCVVGGAEFRQRIFSYVNITNIPHVCCRLGENCGKTFHFLYLMSFWHFWINLLTPNVNYSGRTAPLTSKVAFYILIQQI